MTTVFHASESKIKLPYHTWAVAKYHQMADAGLLDESVSPTLLPEIALPWAELVA